MLAKHTQKNPTKWLEKFKFIFWGQLLGLLPGQTASAILAEVQRAAVPAVGLVVLKEGRKKKNNKVKACGSIAHPKCGEKIQLKSVHSWESCGKIIPFDTELPCNPRLLREVAGWKSSPRQVYNGSAEAAHGQIQRNCFWGGYLGGRKEQPQPAAGAVGLQGCHLQNSHNELLPTSHPSRSSSTPGPAPAKFPNHKWTQGAPCSLPLLGWASRWVQGAGFLRGTCRQARRKTKN